MGFLGTQPDLSEESRHARDVLPAVEPICVPATSSRARPVPFCLIAPTMRVAYAARVSPRGSRDYRAMNERRRTWLTNTHYADTSGLLSENVSSAFDMARLIAHVGGDERIAGIMQKQHHSVTVGKRTVNIHSTNQLVMNGDVDVLGGKTGFIRNAGYCLATLLRLPQAVPRYAVVVLAPAPTPGGFWEPAPSSTWSREQGAGPLCAPPFRKAQRHANYTHQLQTTKLPLA